MGMMTEHSLDYFVANLSQAPVLAQIADLVAGSMQAQTELLRRLEAQPKSESRLAWEAVHPSWGKLIADGMDRIARVLNGEKEVPEEVRRAGCRR
jgi:hypothetical protein